MNVTANQVWCDHDSNELVRVIRRSGRHVVLQRCDTRGRFDPNARPRTVRQSLVVDHCSLVIDHAD